MKITTKLNISDKIYKLDFLNNENKICEYEIKEIDIRQVKYDNKPRIKYGYGYKNFSFVVDKFDESEINKTIFLSKNKINKKLKEIFYGRTRNNKYKKKKK